MSETAAEPLAALSQTKVARTAGSPIIPVAIMGVGAYLAWFGVHYWMSDVKWPSDPVKAVLTGKPAPDNKPVPAGGGLGSSLSSALGDNLNLGAMAGTLLANAQVAQAAMRYAGAGYVFGGDAHVVGDWDCSSFVSKVLGQDLGLTLPGGGKWGDPGYPPHAHGPGSTAYMLYGTGVDAAHVIPGDLVVSVEHIGIVVSPTQMISAQQPSTGTRVSDFPAGFPAGPPVYRRVPVDQLYRNR